MKKLFMAMSLLLSTASFAELDFKPAYGEHGPAGCGLGSILFQDKEGLVFNVLAATFNGSSGTQTFGMSTGTLGCEDAQKAKVSAVSFVEANKIALSNDIARGEGETLNAYLTLIEKRSVNTQTLRTHFGHIFATDESTEIHKKIIALL